MQRNKLLKNPDSDTLRNTISIWDEQLASSGAKIIMDRLKFVDKLKVIANKIHSNLTSNEENLDITYQGYTSENETQLKELLLLKYSESLSKDIHLGYTTVGPHRDDLKIESNGIDLRSFGSQGQQRTAALSLKLSELEIFKNSVGEYPILLLDDVLSELDDTRKLKLLEYIAPMQTLLTCTEFDFDIPHIKIPVSSGKVIK
jgi:DNA replication and repair protein RecF